MNMEMRTVALSSLLNSFTNHLFILFLCTRHVCSAWSFLPPPMYWLWHIFSFCFCFLSLTPFGLSSMADCDHSHVLFRLSTWWHQQDHHASQWLHPSSFFKNVCPVCFTVLTGCVTWPATLPKLVKWAYSSVCLHFVFPYYSCHLRLNITPLQFRFQPKLSGIPFLVGLTIPGQFIALVCKSSNNAVDKKQQSAHTFFTTFSIIAVSLVTVAWVAVIEGVKMFPIFA